MKKKNPHKQIGLNLSSWRIVKSEWCERWHVQDSSGFSFPGEPPFFDSPGEAAAFAVSKGIKNISVDNKEPMTVTLLNCDCMVYMSGLPDKAFDLAVVDVPYGIGESSKDKISSSKSFGRLKNVVINSTDYVKKNWDKESPPIKYFSELFRISNNQIIWGANHFIDKISIPSPCWIVWDKVNYGNDFADCELAWTSFKTAVRQITFQWNGLLQGDMKHKEKRIHPTQKPVALYRWIFANYAKPGQRILDTHLGSGSSAIAAHYAGLEFVGCELDEEYFQAATKRFKEETRQKSLFAPEMAVKQAAHVQNNLI